MVQDKILYSYAYLAGILSFFSPCIFPIIPVYFGILSTGKRSSILKTLFFIMGLSVAFVLLGFGFGIIGNFLTSDIFRIFSGIMIIIFGMVQTGILKIKLLEKTKLLQIETEGSGIISSFLLGFGFSLGWTPCIGPILASILLISSNGDNSLYGAVLMFVYVLGLATPFLIFSFSSQYFFKKLSFLKNI